MKRGCPFWGNHTNQSNARQDNTSPWGDHQGLNSYLSRPPCFLMPTLGMETVSPLRTLRLQLRPPLPGDASALAALMTPRISRCVANWPVPLTPAMAADRMDEAMQAASQGDALPLVPLDAAGTPIGWAIVARTRQDPTCGRIGYWLGEAHQNRGYGSEMAPALLQAAYGRLNLQTIEAAVHPDNAASIALLRAIGMVHVGERMMPIPARNTDELCLIYLARRP